MKISTITVFALQDEFPFPKDVIPVNKHCITRPKYINVVSVEDNPDSTHYSVTVKRNYQAKKCAALYGDSFMLSSHIKCGVLCILEESPLQ